MSINFYDKGTLNASPFEDKPEDYDISEELKRAVNVAIFLGQPLLLTGEPGTGKTALAYHLSDEFYKEKPKVFYTKTTSTASDLYYTYDALKHFQAIQNSGGKEVDVEKYIEYQAMGKLFDIAHKKDEKPNKSLVVLIDEIDKAPRDFPNDLLNELDKMIMEIPELNKKGDKAIHYPKGKEKPLIIITSNSEKNLPEPFLRRCVYFHIPYPKPAQLVQILKKKLLADTFAEDQWESIESSFRKLRTKIERKKPATAELIAWAQYINKAELDPKKLLSETSSELSAEQQDLLKASYSILAKDKDNLIKLGVIPS